MALQPNRLRSAYLRWRAFAGNDQIVLSLLAVAVGAASAYGAIAFRHLITLIHAGLFGARADRLLSAAQTLPWWQILLIPAAGGLAVGLFVHFVMPERRNQGVADVIEAGALRGSRMTLRAGLGAIFAAACSIGCGASVGREGPVVHLGAMLGSGIARRFKRGRATSLTLLGCGVAAGVAASFNAPIAGVFFALEVVIGHYALAAFAPVVIASVTGTIVARLQFGDFPAFTVPEFGIVSYLEFPAFVLLGVVAAAAAGLFMWSVFFTEDTLERFSLPSWARPALGGLAVGAIAIAFPQILGVGYEATDLALNQSIGLWLLIALVAAKIAATAISLGSGFAGGVFSPALYIGAMVGGAFGMIAATAFPEYASEPGAYAVVGMAAVAAAVLGAPISTILIVFELTDEFSLTIAVMIASAVATVVSQQMPGRSFFRWQLERRGIDLARDRAGALLQAIPVSEVMNETVQRIPLEMRLADIRELLRLDPVAVFFVVDDDGRLHGALNFKDLVDIAFDTSADQLINAADIARRGWPAVAAADSLERALTAMAESGFDVLPVVDGEATRRVVGVIRHKNIVIAHNLALAGSGTERGSR